MSPKKLKYFFHKIKGVLHITKQRTESIKSTENDRSRLFIQPTTFFGATGDSITPADRDPAKPDYRREAKLST